MSSAEIDAVVKSQLKEYYGENAGKVEKLKEEISRVELEAYKTKMLSVQKLLKERDEIIKGIKNFWFEALMQSPLNPAFIDAQDTDALKALEDVQIVFAEDPRSFTVTMKFGDNKFFEDKQLVKHFDVKPDAIDKYSLDADLVSEPVEIKWKSEAVNLVKHKPRPNATDAEEFDDFDTGSFFNLFTESTDPADLSAHMIDFFLTAHDVYARLMAPGGDDEDMSEDEEDDEDPTKEIDLSDEERKKKKRRRA